MSRPERLHVPGGRYFVIDDFRAKEVLFPSPERNHTDAVLRELAAHRAQYEAQLAYALSRWCARVHTHCWLPDRALLEIQIGWAPLEHVMHSLRGSFSRYLRKYTAASESAYAGRYKAWLLAPDCTLDLRRELCWQPMRAGLCGHPTEYPHTTLHYALNESVPPFLAKSHLLSWFQQRQHHPRARLLSLLSAAPSPGFSALLLGSPYDRRIIGHPNFVRRIHRERHRCSPVPPPASVIEWAQVFLESATTTLPETHADSIPTLLPALTAWLASCSGAASVSTAATWFPSSERSRLERAIDHYLQSRPDLFSERTLRCFIRGASHPPRTPQAASTATSTAASQGC
jgi:hypothetical protein